MPVVEIEDVADAVPLARTLVEAQLPVIEMTLRTPLALEAVARSWVEIGARARAVLAARSAHAEAALR